MEEAAQNVQVVQKPIDLAEMSIPANAIHVLDGGQGWVGVVSQGGTELNIVNAARVCYGKHSESMTDRDRALIKSLLSSGHMGPFEHCFLTFLVYCPLFVRSQWQRHRTWSYNEISRCYTKKGIEIYRPEHFRRGSGEPVDVSLETRIRLDQVPDLAYDLFQTLLSEGVAVEQARMFLPQSLFCTFYGTVNLRNLMAFLKLRLTKGNQHEIVEYAEAVLKLAKQAFPTVFEDFEKTL